MWRREERNLYEFAREEFYSSLLTRFQMTEQDKQGFSVLLGQIFESLIVGFGAHNPTPKLIAVRQML